MQKITPQTPNLTDKKIEEIGKIFPNVITEKEDDKGNTVKAVDFDLLRQELSKQIVEDDNERYRLDWPGKKRSLLKANTPIDKTLRPVREDSVNFDTTENLYIEGDNFEALKILQESYLGKVKMIYIDPPYNTGKDFVYRDNFKKSKAEYEEELDITDEDGGKLVKNTDTNGRFHSDWLSMMYERLLISRDLLTDDGLIFISIGEDENCNLIKICQEIFGEENFIGQIIPISNPRGSQEEFGISSVHEYMLVFGKSDNSIFSLSGLPRTDIDDFNFEMKDGRKARLLGLRKRGGDWKRQDRPNMFYPLYVNTEDLSVSLSKGEKHTIEVLPVRPSGEESRWTWGPETAKKRTDELVAKEINRNGKSVFDIYRIDPLVSYGGVSKQSKIKSVWDEKELNYQNARQVFKVLFGNSEMFDFPKPIELITKILKALNTSELIVLDFFSGSATTAHAVMQLNAEDSGNRKFIMVQIPEETDENCEAYKAGYKTITEIGKERIRRAAKKIEADYKDELAKRELPLDTGFRVFKVDSTNIEDVARHPSQLTQESLIDLVDNVKPDRTPEDLLIEIMLNSGLELSLPIVRKELNYKTVFFVAENSLVACFDREIDEQLVDEIANLKPLKVVLRDASFKDDKDRINLENRFKSLSPDTVVSVI